MSTSRAEPAPPVGSDIALPGSFAPR